MRNKTVMKLTNNMVIFILTGIIYVFFEVFATSILGSSMLEKYQFNPIEVTKYNEMAFQPPKEEIIQDLVYLRLFKGSV